MMRKNLCTKEAILSLLLVVWFFPSQTFLCAGDIATAGNEPMAASVAPAEILNTNAGANPDGDVDTAIKGLLARKHLDPAEFFAHWLDNTFHSVFADFDNDGRLDAAFSGRLSGHRHKIEVWRRNGAGWGDPVFLDESYAGAQLSVGDINNDGFVDLITTEPLSHLVTGAWLGSATGTFTLCTDIAPFFFSNGSTRFVSYPASSLVGSLPARFRHYGPSPGMSGPVFVDRPQSFYSPTARRILSRLWGPSLWGRSPPL